MIEHRWVDGCVSAMTLFRPLRPRSLTCVLLTLQLLLKSTAPALIFLFPNHSDDFISVPENSEIRIPFGVQGLESIQQSQLFISVYNSTGQSMLKICSIIYYTNNRSYMISDENFICVNQTGPVPLMFRTTVSRWEDKSTLVWQVMGFKDLEKTLRLDVTYPATVVSLTFTHEASAQTSVVEEGPTSVQLLCLWVNGNPPSAARLLDRKRNMLTELDVGTTSDNLTYRLTYSPKQINCSSSGVITCEASGAEVNRSVTLLVRCPPEFQAVNGTPVIFDNRNTSVRIVYRVRAHTNDTEKCELKKLQSAAQKVLVFLLPPSAFRCLLTGQPPDLMLTVVMNDMNYITEGAEHLWRLELTNDKGTGSVEFSLPIVVGFKATCVVPPVEPLGNTSLTCHFPEDVSKTKNNFIVDVVPENGKTEVALNCWWRRDDMKCYTREGYRYDRIVSDRITLQIPRVSPEQYGRYNCFFFNISSVYSEACVLEKTAGLSLKLPHYPGDVVMAMEKTQIQMALDIEGLKGRSHGDDVRVVAMKNHVDTLCDVIFGRATGHVINRSPMSFCSSEATPHLRIVFSMEASCEDNGAILTWQIWRGNWFTGPEKSLLLNIT